MYQTADAIVIGAGSTGCSIAFHLARRGVKVLLMERDSVAAGPTGRSVAIIRQHYTHSAVSRLAHMSAPFFQNWRDEVGGDCGFVRTGFLTAVAERDGDALRANVRDQRKLGVDVELVSIEQMQKMQPDMVPAGLGGGAYEAMAGYCDPKAASLDLAGGVRRYGGVVLQGHLVRSIRVKAGSVQGVDTSEGRFDAPIVVNAAGPWAARLAATTGTRLPITACRHCIALVREAQPTQLPPLPAYTELVNRFYLRPEAEGSYVVGSLDPADSSSVEPDDCTPAVRTGSVINHAARAAGRFHRLKDACVIEGWASMFDDTPDGNPLVGADPTNHGSFVAAGLCGHGFKLCPVIGQGLADLVTEGRTEVPIDIFALNRFAQGRLLTSAHPYLGTPDRRLVS
jgi:sarcosine oxidase, subunit beta